MTSGLPTVTAIVAAYNYAGFIARTLDSALNQDYPPELLDIVVVDDGSSDETPAVLADYSRRYPGRVRCVRQDNAGYVAATNRAAALATGELIAVLDADDLWPVDKTRRQVRQLTENPELGLVYCDTEIIDPYDVVRRRSLWQWLEMTPARGPSAFTEIMHRPGNAALASTILFRAALAEHAFPIPLRAPYVDWWVTARLAAVAGIDYAADLKVGYRQHGENLTLGATGMQRVRETLKCAEVRRQLLIHGAADHLSTPELFDAWQAWEGAALTAVQQAASAYVPTAIPDERERKLAAAHAAEAHRATVQGRLTEALRHRILALAANPLDAASREWLHELAWLGRPAASDAAPARDAGPAPDAAPAPDPLAQARRFVTLAYGSELSAEPELLAAYAQHIDEAADATLVISALGLGAEQALAEIARVAHEAGLELATLPDVLVVNEGGPATAIELERRADAILTRRPPRLDTPAFKPERLPELRALVSR